MALTGRRKLCQIFIRFRNCGLQSRAFTTEPLDRPQPIPLADKEAQIEFETLQKQFSMIAESLAARGETGFETKADPLIDESGRNIITGEINGPNGKEPTRFGDWERKGRVSDF